MDASLDGLIPEARLAEVRRFLAEALPGVAVDQVERLPGGRSGAEILKVTAGGRAYLLRLASASNPLHDPTRQHACQRIAAEADLAPRLVHADAKMDATLSVFVEADPVAGARAPRLAAVAEAVRRLHATALCPPAMPYFDAVEGLLGQLAASAVLAPDVLDEILRLYRPIAAAYPRDRADLVSSHNDLNPNNILFRDGQALFVDWDTAFAADRYVDLSSVLNFHAVDAEDEDLFIDTYFGRKPTEAEVARLFLMRQVNRLVYGAVLIRLAAGGSPGLRLTAADLDTPPVAEVRQLLAEHGALDAPLRVGCAFLSDALKALRGLEPNAALSKL